MSQWSDTEDLRSLMKFHIESGSIAEHLKSMDRQSPDYPVAVQRFTQHVMGSVHLFPSPHSQHDAFYNCLYRKIETLVMDVLWELTNE